MLHAKNEREKKLRLISFLGFLFGFSITLLIYITSSYFKEALQSENVGLFYVAIFVVLLGFLLNLDKFFTLVGRGRALIILLLWQVSTLFALSMAEVSYFGAFLLVTYFIIYGIIAVLWDVALDAYSTASETGRIRGFFLSVYSIGLLFGPMVGTRVLESYGFHGVFLVATILYILMFIISLIALSDLPGHRPQKHIAILGVAKDIFTQKPLFHVYILAILLRIFYTAMSIYMPLYLRDLGFAWSEIGLMFTIMMVPFILLEYPAGILADKKWGEKELLITGLVLIIVGVILMWYVREPVFWMWASILVISRSGCAFFQSMQDSYFYKNLGGENIALSNFYRTARPLGAIIASLCATVILIFGDIRDVFLAVAIALSFGALPLYYLKDTIPESQRK